MSWFNLLKVDVDFARLPKDWLGAYYNDDKRIEIDEKQIYDYLQSEGKATDEEVIDYLVRVINHEAAHAAHHQADDKYLDRFKSQKEYIAFALENIADPIHLRLVNYVNHPDVKNTARGEKIKQMLQDVADMGERTNPEKMVRMRLRIMGLGKGRK